MSVVSNYERERRKRMREAKPKLKEAMRELAAQQQAAVQVVVSYDGAGDEGGIKTIDWLDADGKTVVSVFEPGLNEPGIDEVEEYIYSYGAQFDGDGSHGEVVYEVGADKVRHRHYEYETISKRATDTPRAF